MSLVPTNVFDDAEVLHTTYQRLTTWVQMKLRKGMTTLKSRDKARIKEARRALQRLDGDLLEKLTPEVFRRLVVLEWSDSLADRKRTIVSRRIWQLAGRTLAAAKRLAHLIVHATILYQPPAGVDTDCVKYKDETDRCFDFLHFSIQDGGAVIQRDRLVNYSTTGASPGVGFGFVRQLIEAANQGDRMAHDYLRLFYRALALWRLDLQAVTRKEYLPSHAQQFFDSIYLLGTTGKEGGPPVLSLPLCYPDAHCRRLAKVREEELACLFGNPECDLEWPVREAFRKQVVAIALDAYDGFLEAMWKFICDQQAPHLALSGGRDKVEVRIPYFRYLGLPSFAFVREKAGGSFYPYPEIGINLFIEHLCERTVRRVALDREGRIQGFADVEWPPHLAAALWCFVLDAYAEIVVPDDRKGGPDDPRRNRPRLLKAHHAEEDTFSVRPHFRKLPPGWQASERQIQEAILATGIAPTRGYTFVGEFQRGFPGVALGYEEARTTWETHRRLAPSLVITEACCNKLLEQIPNFL